MKASVYIGFIFLVSLWASIMEAAVLEVELPPYIQWCTRLELSSSVTLSPEIQQNIQKRALEYFSGCARVCEIPKIGVLSMDSINFDLKTQQVTFTICCAAPGDVEVCDGLELRVVKKQRILAALCAAGASASCKEELEAVLKSEPWQLDISTIQHLQWKFVGTTANTLTPEAVIDAITGFTLKVVLKDETVGDSESYTFVIVAVVLPEMSSSKETRK